MKKLIVCMIAVAALGGLSETWHSFDEPVGLYTETRVSSGFMAGCTEFNPEQFSVFFPAVGELNIRLTATVRSSETNSAITTLSITKEDLLAAVGTNEFAAISATFTDFIGKVIAYKRSQP